MHTNKTFHSQQIKTTLSTIWIFILFNIIFRDLHELARPGFLQQMMTGIVNGTQITDILLLWGGIMIEVPIAMVLFSKLLKDRASRLANLITVPIFLLLLVANNLAPDMDDLFFAAIEVVAAGFIFWTAWKWKVTNSESAVMA